jgi:hypothetical protein
MDQQSTTISDIEGAEADLVYLAAMTERPHGSIGLRTIALYSV